MKFLEVLTNNPMPNKFNDEILREYNEKFANTQLGNPYGQALSRSKLVGINTDIKLFLLSTITKVREDERKLLADKVEKLKTDYCIKVEDDGGYHIALDTVLQVLKDK